jgi:hypothetical protein
VQGNTVIAPCKRRDNLVITARQRAIGCAHRIASHTLAKARAPSAEPRLVHDRAAGPRREPRLVHDRAAGPAPHSSCSGSGHGATRSR